MVRLCATLVALLVALPAWAADERPGAGVDVRPAVSGIVEEEFQHRILYRALADLGYTVTEPIEVMYVALPEAIAASEADFTAVFWDPMTVPYYQKAGGDGKLMVQGSFIENVVQGLLVDQKTARTHGITSLHQLKDPDLAKLFDRDGDGKAELIGCNAGWACETAIEKLLAAAGVQDTVEQVQGDYFEAMNAAIEDVRQGKPVLYYAWSPSWVNAVLEPGAEVRWLDAPGEGRYGFPVNTQRILVNRDFALANPAAMRLFEVANIPIADINQQNYEIHTGENTSEAIDKDVDAWIAEHRTEYDRWLAAARAATR